MTVESAPAFPVEWNDEEEAAATWLRDDMHFPEPLTPLTISLGIESFNTGNPRAADELSLPMGGLRSRAFNGYIYNWIRPVPEEELSARLERNGREMPGRMDALGERWRTEYLPRVLRLTADIEVLDLEQAPPEERPARLARLRELLDELWHVHFLVVFTKLGCGERFYGLYSAATGSDDQTAAYRCLQGFPNKSVEAGKALWELAQEAAASDAVRAAIEHESADEALDALAATEEGRAFRASFERYLDEYGRRANGIELALPLWLETPGFVLGLVRAYLAGEASDPEAEQAELAEEREALIATALQRVAGSELEAPFRGALAAAQAAWPLEEDHAFYIDQRAFAAVRLQLAGLGRRLVAEGRLGAADDVWFAEAAELASDADLTEVARERREERERQRTLDPPPFLGAPPEGAPDPGLEKFFGKAGPPELEDGVLRGSPASSGRVTGTARVVARIDELDRVRPGDVLVCRSTTPPWTPVFGSISALVADTGGVLSHGAIVAREYRIPAVMGTKIGTRAIADGQTITVDGDRGEVLLGSGAPSGT